MEKLIELKAELLKSRKALTIANNRIAFLEIRIECQEIKEKEMLEKLKKYEHPPKMASLYGKLAHANKKLRELEKVIQSEVIIEYEEEIKTLQFRIEMMRETIQDQGATVGAVRDAIERKRGEPQQKPILFDRGKVFLNPLAVAV